MELLFELIFSVLFEALFALLAAGGEYVLFRTRKRFWMWVFGLVAIMLMMWWRGTGFWTTWALAGGWLAALFWLDWRMMRQDRDNDGEVRKRAASTDH